MIIIADNLNTRNKAYMEALRVRDKKTISDIAARLSHADMINLQCSLDGSGDEEALPWLVEAVSEGFDRPLCLDSRNIPAISKSLSITKRHCLINFISGGEPPEPESLFELISNLGASVVLRASKTTPPTSLEAKLQILDDLIEMANSMDIPNERLFLDPSLVHIGSGVGQKHMANSIECIRALKEIIEPPIKTIAWVSNVSGGMPLNIAKTIEPSFFLYASGAGLDAAMLDVLDEGIIQAVYLVKSFRDEIIFTPADLS